MRKREREMWLKIKNKLKIVSSVNCKQKKYIFLNLIFNCNGQIRDYM